MKNIVIKFQVSPSFPDDIEIEIILENRGDKWVLSGGYGKMYDKQKVEKDIPSTQVNRVLAFLSSSRISPIPTFAMGVDGTTYSLEVSTGYNSVSYTWWGTIPDEYEPFKELIKSLLSWAEIKYPPAGYSCAKGVRTYKHKRFIDC